MNRLLQRFVGDTPPPSEHQAAPPAASATADSHAARENPQLASLLAPPPRHPLAAPPRSANGGRLYPLPPSSSGGPPPPVPRSSDGMSAPPPPPAPGHQVGQNMSYFYQYNPYQYQAEEFARSQPHPAPPPSSSGSQRRASGAGSVYEDVPLSNRSTYETVDLNDDARPLPGRTTRQLQPQATPTPPRSSSGSRKWTPAPSSTGSSASTDAFFQGQPLLPPSQPQQQYQPQHQSQPLYQPQQVPHSDARSASELFASPAPQVAVHAVETLPPPPPPPLQAENHVDSPPTDATTLFASPARPSAGIASSVHDGGPMAAADLSASSLFSSEAVPGPAPSPKRTPPRSPPLPPSPALSAASRGRSLSRAASPSKPTHRRTGSSSSMSGVVWDGRQARGGAFPSRPRSVDWSFEGERRGSTATATTAALGRSQVTTLDDSMKLADMYKQMAERLQGEKQALLKVVADQADQIAALHKRVAALERARKASGGPAPA